MDRNVEYLTGDCGHRGFVLYFGALQKYFAGIIWICQCAAAALSVFISCISYVYAPVQHYISDFHCRMREAADGAYSSGKPGIFAVFEVPVPAGAEKSFFEPETEKVASGRYGGSRKKQL